MTRRTTEERPTKAERTLRITVNEWDDWLARHHESNDGVLLVIEKKTEDRQLPSYAEALDIALTWGWIDGKKQALDEKTWLQRFTRRRAKSSWSKINRDHAERLIAEGRMRPPGLAEVERAKDDGRWAAAYDSARAATVHPELAEALARNSKAQALFEKLDSANRYAILYRVQTAKKAETRTSRIRQLVAMLARGETIHPRRAKR